MSTKEMLSMVAAVMRNYRLERKLRNRMAKAPFNTAYLRALLDAAKPGVVIEIIKPGEATVRITKEDRQGPRPGGMDYYDISRQM